LPAALNRTLCPVWLVIARGHQFPAPAGDQGDGPAGGAAALMGDGVVALPPGVPALRSDAVDQRGWAIQASKRINENSRGNISATVLLTLAPTDTVTRLHDNRIGPYSIVALMAR